MMRLMFLIVGLVAGTWPAHAIVGGAPVATDDAARAAVTIVGTRGSYCSGALIAPDIVLTAAHCVQRGGTYKVALSGDPLRPVFLDVARIAVHPRFSAQDMANHRAGADVALLQLASPAAALPLPATAVPTLPVAAGRRFRIAGSGLTGSGSGPPGGAMRSVTLVATGQPGALQIRLVDPSSQNKRGGLGACDGDSGGPVFEDQKGRSVIVGVVAWSTAPGNAAGCGGLTGVTPLTLYEEWIVQAAKAWGSKLD